MTMPDSHRTIDEDTIRRLIEQTRETVAHTQSVLSAVARTRAKAASLLNGKDAA